MARNWHILIDLVQQIDRPNGDVVYWRASYWATEAARLAGQEPTVTNDFWAGDMLRWIGQPIFEKRARYDGADPLGEFFCEGSEGSYGNFTHAEHWVSGREKYGLRPVDGVDRQIRLHFPKRFVVGTYTEAHVRDWMYEQSEDWIAAHFDKRGDFTDPALAVDRAAQREKLPQAVREMALTRDATVEDGESKRKARQGMRDMTGVRA